MSRDKTKCKKCGQPLPVEPPPPRKRFPMYLNGTVIVPGLRHGEEAIKLEKTCPYPWSVGADFPSYTNVNAIEFEPCTQAKLTVEQVIVQIEGTYHLMPLSHRIYPLQGGDTISFAKGTLNFIAPDWMKK